MNSPKNLELVVKVSTSNRPLSKISKFEQVREGQEVLIWVGLHVDEGDRRYICK